MAKYVVSGTIGGKAKFSMEVDAKSEKHAERLVLSKIGSSQGAKATKITVVEVKKG